MKRIVAELNEIDKAYLAGLMDADGHVSICSSTSGREKPQYWLQVGVTQSNKDFLELIQEKIGVGKIYRNNKAGTNNFNSQQRYQLQIHGRVAARLLEQLFDFLILKRKQAEVGIEFGKTITGHVDEATQAKRESLKKMMTNLNTTS